VTDAKMRFRPIAAVLTLLMLLFVARVSYAWTHGNAGTPCAINISTDYSDVGCDIMTNFTVVR